MKSLTVPIVVCCILGYIISSGFFAVFSTAVNTLMLCFCEGKALSLFQGRCDSHLPKGQLSLIILFENTQILSDCRVNDGTPEKPYFMPRGMMQFVATADHSIKSGKYENEENVPLRTMK